MRIYKKLEDSMEDSIKVKDIVAYCNQGAEVNAQLADKAIASTGRGESDTSALGAAAYFLTQERILRYDIPNILTCIINEPLQSEEDRDPPNQNLKG